MRFQDRVALITAAGSGIGRATAEIISRDGGVVVGVDTHKVRLGEVVGDLLLRPQPGPPWSLLNLL